MTISLYFLRLTSCTRGLTFFSLLARTQWSLGAKDGGVLFCTESSNVESGNPFVMSASSSLKNKKDIRCTYHRNTKL